MKPAITAREDAPPVEGTELKRQRAADQRRFRRKVDAISRDKLEQATGSKSDVELIRVFADINKVGYNDDGARQRRANRAMGSFVRLRYNEQDYATRAHMVAFKLLPLQALHMW